MKGVKKEELAFFRCNLHVPLREVGVHSQIEGCLIGCFTSILTLYSRSGVAESHNFLFVPWNVIVLCNFTENFPIQKVNDSKFNVYVPSDTCVLLKGAEVERRGMTPNFLCLMLLEVFIWINRIYCTLSPSNYCSICFFDFTFHAIFMRMETNVLVSNGLARSGCDLFKRY
jgi:uncharacterized integral membrane protein